MRLTLFKFPYRYFPYECDFLESEARLFGKVVEMGENKIVVEAPNPAKPEELCERLRRLTYFARFQINEQLPLFTDQFRFETTANGSGAAFRRQSTRYSTHGLHEYKGKFNPQIARHLMNRSGIGPNSVVFDPFCGCGTVLVEAVHYGCSAIGTDSNPLSAILTNAKLCLLRAKLSEIDEFQCAIRSICLGLDKSITPNSIQGAADELNLAPESLKYLHSWFPVRTLAKLLNFRLLSKRTLSKDWALVADALISSIARDVSYQDPGDLRIRRRKGKTTNPPLEGLIGSVITTVAKRAKSALLLIPSGRQIFSEAFYADSRNSAAVLRPVLGQLSRQAVDAVITSPPYATALPYIDTSRLSLVLLGLSEPRTLRKLEKQQIGNREIAESRRKELEREFENYVATFPTDLSGFLLKLFKSVQKAEVGFRKRNVPALLALYFTSIREVLLQTTSLLKKQGASYWVVGKNRTQVGEQWVEIDTPRWIAATGTSAGLQVQTETLNTYQRFGLHQRNSIRGESLITFRRAQHTS